MAFLVLEMRLYPAKSGKHLIFLQCIQVLSSCTNIAQKQMKEIGYTSFFLRLVVSVVPWLVGIGFFHLWVNFWFEIFLRALVRV